MKRYLFLDNFRGFVDTYIPLADVTFLVGQNSTGKTSVLKLLRLISSPRFFMGQDYSSDEPQFGHFNELVSAHSDDRSYFRIGSTEEYRGSKKGSSSVSGMLITYRERGGLPQMSHFTLSLGSREVSLRFEDSGRVLCKTQEVPRADTAIKMNSNFPRWIQDHAGLGTGWSELVLPLGYRGVQIPLAMMLSLASQRDSKDRALGFFMPPFPRQLVWIAPIRTEPKRTYDAPGTSFSSDGSHTAYVIRRMLASKSESKKFADFMSRVGLASGLFENIDTNVFGQQKDDATAPFEVDAIVDGKPLNLTWVGYGVSQSLPILVELLDKPQESWFAIQQPEVHLHPRAQASLGDVFFEMAAHDKKCFLIETHSDFAIDRFRMNFRNRKKTPESQVLFFERRNKRNIVTSLPIGPRGDLPKDQPESYRNFFVKEEMRVLGL